MDFSLAHEEHETQLLSHSLNRGGISNLAALNVRELETGPLLVVLNNSGRALVLTGKGRVDLEPKTKYGVLTCLSTLESIKIARLGLVGQQVLLAPNYPKMPDIQACFAVDPIWSGVSKALATSGISLATIEPLTGSNFKKWKADIEIYLGLLNIDICLTEDAPGPITDDTSDIDKVHAQEWLRADRMTKLILKRTMSETVRGSVPDEGTARDYLNNIADMYQESEKAETGQLLDSLITMKYGGSTGVREHIMRMIETAAKLRDLLFSRLHPTSIWEDQKHTSCF